MTVFRNELTYSTYPSLRITNTGIEDVQSQRHQSVEIRIAQLALSLDVKMWGMREGLSNPSYERINVVV